VPGDRCDPRLMQQSIDDYPNRRAALEQANRRNGSHRRPLLSEPGEIALAVPRNRRFTAIAVRHAYAGRAEQLGRLIMACFVLGSPVRKGGHCCR
jgi:transposase-like protein